VANDWTVIGVQSPSSSDDAPVAAVDVRPFHKDDPLPKVHAGAKLPPVWRGTLLPKTDADLWLSVAFAEFEKIVASAVRRLGRDVPLAELKRSWSDQNWHRIAVGKGTLLLASLRNELGDEKFDALMDDFGARHGGKEVTTEAFLAHALPADRKNLREDVDKLLHGSSEIINDVDGPEDSNPWAVDSFEDEPQQALIVYGTTADKAAQREAAELLQKNIAARWCNYLVPLKADTDLTLDELKSHHVLLIGRPATNSVTARYADGLGVKFGSQSFTVGNETYAHPRSAILFAAENPLSKRYSLVVYAGNGADATWHAVQAFPDCGGRGAEGVVLAHGAKPRPLAIPAK
jgi:hypothetical protein